MTATEVIDSAVHLHIDHAACDCDWDDEGHIANGVLDALKAAGYAVVELPKRVPIPAYWHADCLGGWKSTLGDPVSAWPSSTSGCHGVALPDAQFISSAAARTFAAALLAAANAVDSSE